MPTTPFILLPTICVQYNPMSDTESPLIVPDAATRAMLCERGYTVRSAAG